jgi:hypothetical protein
MTEITFPRCRLALVLAATLAASGCVVLPPAAAPVSSAATPAATPAAIAASGPAAAFAKPAAGTAATAATAATSATPATPAGAPPTFASIIKDARRIDGPLTLWQKEDKVWIELKPEQFGQPYLLSPKIKKGMGEAGVLGGLMIYDDINGFGGPQVVEFVQVHKVVRLQARNMLVLAREGTPEARAVAAAYSNSLLASANVASAPHPDRKSVLVEANGLFLNDLMGIGQRLQRGLRAGYSLERSNSTITAARGTAEASILETELHFVGGSAPQQQPGLLGALLGAPPSGGASFLPDSRSMLVTLHYSLAPLPAKPMATRAADPRIGLFTTQVLNFSDDLQRTPRQRFVNRWRLEKKDPTAAMSEPVEPITFWIDRNVPLLYRDTVRSAILEWNKAFEKIGFKDAILAKQQPEDANFDTLDYGRASVRWMLNAEPVFGAIGPSHVDPRTGEILDADIAFEGMSARMLRGVRRQILTGDRTARVDIGPAPDFAPRFDLGLQAAGQKLLDAAYCLHAELGVEQMSYALDVLQARGELEPDSPMAQQFVLDYVKDSIMHEVGHALGLRHNFRASRAYSEAQLSDPEFTRANGTTASVMEYNAVNLPRPGERGGLPFQATLGPYDYWAIEYAYKPLAAEPGSAEERTELQAIAARSAEPLLAYGTDEDNAFGLDPETLQLDLGKDPIAFVSKRLDIARDLFRRQEKRTLPKDQDYAVLRRSLDFALGDATRAVGVLVRQIGGLRTLRDFPGSGRDPLQPVDADIQRQALALISSAVLSNSAAWHQTFWTGVTASHRPPIFRWLSGC